MRKFTLVLCTVSLILNPCFYGCFALSLDELNEPKALDNRMGISSVPEAGVKNDAVLNNTKQIQSSKTVQSISKSEVNPPKKDIKQLESENSDVFDKTYADLSLKNLANDVNSELEIEEQTLNSDLSILWAAALERSETMKYTIYKLSNPDEDKPNDSTIKKIIKPIANLSTVAGAGFMGDPYAAAGALIGGGLVNAFMKDDKEYNYRFSKVSDADMVLLVRKIDDLQKKLLNLYIDYKTKQELMNMQNENFKKQEQIYNESKNQSQEVHLIADSYYRNAKNDAQKASDEFLTSKAILENLVGVEALNKINQ